MHNNIIGISAYWSLIAYDPEDTEEKKVYGNMFFRSAELSTIQDTSMRVRGLRTGAAGGGSLEVLRNYATEFETGLVDGELFSDNVILDPTVGASIGTSYSEVLTGNNTFTTDVNGFLVYTSPDDGVTVKSQAKTLIADFCKPINGWAYDAGPINPSTWPTEWKDV